MRLLPFLVLLFPVLELAVLIKIGGELGVLATIVLLFIDAVVGLYLIRIAGPATLWRMRARIESGQAPEQEMLGGLLLGVAGLLLFIPGFVSDLLAILCLLPFTRSLLSRQFGRKMGASRNPQDADFGQGGNPQPRRNEPPQTIDGEWERKDN